MHGGVGDSIVNWGKKAAAEIGGTAVAMRNNRAHAVVTFLCLEEVHPRI